MPRLSWLFFFGSLKYEFVSHSHYCRIYKLPMAYYSTKTKQEAEAVTLLPFAVVVMLFYLPVRACLNYSTKNRICKFRFLYITL